MIPCFKILSRVLVSGLFGSVVVAMAAESALKTTAVVGEVTLQKAGEGEWHPVKVGAKAKQADKVRTAVESQVSFQFNDGSVITIAENSIVELKTLFQGDGVANTKLGVKTGKVLFNIQKLANARSTFEFESQTATAAIRGTEGDVQVNGSRSLASLLTGKLEMFSQAGRATIGPGQMVLQTPTGFVVLPKPKDQKNYQQLADKYLLDTNATVDSMVTEIKRKLDSLGVKDVGDSLKDTAKVLDSAGQGSACVIDAYLQEISVAKIQLTGKAPEGSEISTGAVKVKTVGGVWKLDLAWAPDRFGPRAYPVTALIGGNKIPCGEAKFVYLQGKLPLDLKLSMPNPTEICKGPLLLSGSYTGTGARLIAKLGPNQIDLSSSTGTFSKAIAVSDQTRNWDVTQVEFVLANEENSISKSVALNPNRTCREVNRIAPVIIASMQPNICMASLGIGAAMGDEVKVSILSDGAEIESFATTSDIRGRRVLLQEGEHSYLIRAIDLAGNKAEQSFPRVTCWPDVRFDIVLGGPAKELLRIPPPPPGMSDRVTKRLEFSVRNLPRDDYGYIKRVTVRQNGRSILDLRTSQIRDTQFETEVELSRGKVNLFRIEVEAQNGRVRTVDKEYDFK